MTEPLKIGIAGLGTVGAGVVKLLAEHGRLLSLHGGRRLKLVAVSARSRTKKRDIDLSGVRWEKDPLALATAPDIDVVVELIGGSGGIAKRLAERALRNGKHVVMANKALLAMHGAELAALAEKRGAILAFEAAVAGGIPIIKALREGLTANRIEWIAGIVNGTTNFILSEMREKRIDFQAALADAQRLGYAEADPTFDIAGIDAAHKATIVSAIAFGVPVQFAKAHVEGIVDLQAVDIAYAEQLGYRIKLLAITKRRAANSTHPGGIELRVHPTLVPSRRLIANVEGAMNAVMVQGDAVGTTLYYGKGAGAEPTASAVIADLVDIARLATADPDHRVPHLAFQPAAMQDLGVLPIDDVVTAFYLRLQVADETGVLARITGILAEHGISIDALLQRPNAAGAGEARTDVIILTHDTVEGRMRAAIAKMQALPTVLAKIVRIRKEDLA